MSTNNATKLADRNKVAGGNRMELLLFRLGTRQLYGINVFKVKEILPCPKMINLPHSMPEIRGVAHIRDTTLSILDLGMAIGQPPIQDLSASIVIITEYNRRTQGFLVNKVERIVNLDWEAVRPPPSGSGKESFLTAVTQLDQQLIEIIDVEKILAHVDPLSQKVTSDLMDEEIRNLAAGFKILLVDDSSVARHQVERNLDEIGIHYLSMTNGREALDYLNSLAEAGKQVADELLMMITDIEMPEMDGYTLTRLVKQDPRLAPLPVLLHSSLSGIFNDAMAKKVGANFFLAKYDADELARVVIRELRQVNGIPNS